MALLKGKTAEQAQEDLNKNSEAEVVEQVVETKPEAEVVETEQKVEQAKEPEVEAEKAEPEADQVKEPEPEIKKSETKKDSPVNEQVVEDAEIVEEAKVETETAPEVVEETKAVETEQVESKSEPSTAVAEVEQNTAVAKQEHKAVATSQVIEAAADNGFDGLELGFGSFSMIKLANEGQFEDSDDNELGKHIRAVLQQSTPVYLYKQEGNDEGPIAYSYDRKTITAYTGEDDDDFKTIEEIKASWAEDGYDLEEKKYLEVVATIVEDHEDFIDGDVPEGLEDLEGETVMFRLAPASLKGFSGKVATLQMQNKPIKGAVMDFLVGKKRKSNGGKTYFPWKFRLVK